MEKGTGATILYRIFGEGRRLLYVGITDGYDKRMGNHSEKWWWREVRAIDTVEYATREDAKVAESVAIRTELPAYNKAEHPEHVRSQKRQQAIPPANSTGKRRLISMEAAADYLGVSTLTVRRRIAAGQLRAYRLGPRMVRVDLNDVEALLQPIPATGTWAE